MIEHLIKETLGADSIKNKIDAFNPDKRLNTGLRKEIPQMNQKNNLFNPDKRIKPEKLPNGIIKESNKEVLFDGIEKSEVGLDKLIKDYIKDLKDNAAFPELISDKPFDVSDLKKTDATTLRKEFKDIKNDLIDKWEANTGKSWPRYKENVYIENKNGDKIQIRQPGERYDAHHIQPLSQGGKNVVENITPIKADVHFDSKGIHADDRPSKQIDKRLGGD